MKTVHPGRFVTIVQAFEHVHPATELRTVEIRTGAEYVIANIPEKRDVYTVGQELQFGSVNSARTFVKSINEQHGQVCRVGKVQS